MKLQSTANFVEAYLAGDALASDIYAYIDRWHEQPGDQSLPDHLGMTDGEYGAWLENPDVLGRILRANKTRSALAER